MWTNCLGLRRRGGSDRKEVKIWVLSLFLMLACMSALFGYGRGVSGLELRAGE